MTETPQGWGGYGCAFYQYTDGATSSPSLESAVCTLLSSAFSFEPQSYKYPIETTLKDKRAEGKKQAELSNHLYPNIRILREIGSHKNVHHIGRVCPF